ncbi:multiple C2 and transmembrane domain-containing protein 1-like isoform X7 [Physella acuta]|uniref:multiple C2 and transmembrane domain-containing protein 1-like isoform X7 n=1 Tax=Physella acuta TaxID=109671 RepID=UPI0027DAD6BB|nr:multiple C2 and transmembrane domain-containing protein 1-like isoform X7 [Physella acuta]XP_059155459.1 multiple C2 and transmembrane domain-containing protein 1-like isoform X7 [Physella acuta]XP_059155460.1 multiple C2 and transmembrane domain-containing protein 1-like isoform X7 [Physella acuta]
MAEAGKPPPRSYIPAFLLRRGQKTKKKLAGTQRAAELRQTDAVSKSVDSLLSVASSISLPPDATLREHRPDRHSLQSSSTSQVRSSNGQVRRHSYDFSVNDNDMSDMDATSSSQEPSPVPGQKEVKKTSQDSPEYWRPVRQVNRQSTLSSVGPSMSSASDWDSADSDIDEKNSVMFDAESQNVVLSDEDNTTSSTGSPVVKVHTMASQDPGSGPLGHQLQQHSFFVLHVHLKEGKDLVIRDSCGTSDPYVKFKIGGKLLYKSRTIYKNLNPKWDEQFSIHIEDITKPINIKVFDYDRAWNDDPMGGVDIDVTTLEVNKATELKLLLTERGNTEYMGYLILNCTLSPKTNEDKEQETNAKRSLFRRSTRSTESATASKKLKMQLWNGVVNIILVEGSNLVSMDDNGLSDPYVKFKLGTEKYRSKFKSKTLNPRWLEQFDLRLFDDQTALLEISVYDHDTRGKDDFMGRAVIDLSQLERERTHTIVQPLEDGAGTIKLLLTVSGTFGGELTSDLANYTPNPLDKDNIVSKYGLLNSLRNIDDIGHLEVKVFRAHGLQSADFGGLSDPFCVIELINDRVQTQTEYKTLNPEWAKVFTFNVKDIHSVLEVTVYDEDRNKKVEFLGKVAIPLLRIKNGERRWYALKDRKTLHKTKGAILLEMDMVYNHLKAAIRTVNPKEEKLMLPDQKFKISTMKQNINRVSQIIGVFIDTGRFIQSCFDWQSPPRTITAFIVYLVAVWNFELYMLPISLLLIFIKNLVIAQIVGSFKKEPVEDDYFVEDEDDDEDEKDKQEEKKSIVDRYHAIQEVCLQVQQGLDTVACLGERVKNTFNWSVPWLSALAVIALSAGIIVLYYIPLRYLLLAWGINKFTKKLRKPNAISNNELLDFLSRIPSDNELLQYRELRPDIPANTTSSKKKRA